MSTTKAAEVRNEAREVRDAIDQVKNRMHMLINLAMSGDRLNPDLPLGEKETLRRAIKEEQAKTEADLGEEPDLSQDEAIDDMDGIANYYSQEGYAKGLRFALDVLTRRASNEN